MELLPHQKEILDRNPKRHGIFFGTGTGKTYIAISLAEKNCGTCLIIVPKMLKKKWERDIISYGEKCFYNIITKEDFRRDAHVLPKYDGVIVDESHFFFGISSQLSKRLYSYMKRHGTPFRWLLTATPYLSSVWNIYTAARLLGHEWNYNTIKNEFFYDVRMGHRMIPVQKKNIEGKVAQLVKSIGSTIDLAEAVDLAKESGHEMARAFSDGIPDQIFETEYFDLTEEQEKAIEELDDVEFITRFTKTHCIENGILYSDGYTKDREFKSLKTDRLQELAFSTPKVAIICRYNGQIEYLKHRFEHFRKPVRVINGDVKDRDKVIEEANRLEQCIILIQAACSAGYELPTFNTIVFASLSFALVDHEQMIGRFLRINALTCNRYVYLVTNGVDKDIYDCIMAKKDFSIAIYAKDRAMVE